MPRERGQKKREESQRQLLGKHLNPGVGRRPSAREAGELGQNCAPGAVGGEIFYKERRINIDRLEKGAYGQILRRGLEFKFFKESSQWGCEIDFGIKKGIKRLAFRDCYRWVSGLGRVAKAWAILYLIGVPKG